MPQVLPHPTIPGSYYMQRLPGEPQATDPINVSITFDTPRLGRQGTITATVAVSPAVPLTGLGAPQLAPGENTPGALTISGYTVTGGTSAAVTKATFTITSNYAANAVLAATNQTVSILAQGADDANGTGQATFYLNVDAPQISATWEPRIGHIYVTWTPYAKDIQEYYVWKRSASSPAPTATTTPNFRVTTNFLLDKEDGIDAYATWYYWVMAIDVFGNKGNIAGPIGPTSARQILNADISDFKIEASKFVAGALTTTYLKVFNALIDRTRISFNKTTGVLSWQDFREYGTLGQSGYEDHRIYKDGRPYTLYASSLTLTGTSEVGIYFNGTTFLSAPRWSGEGSKSGTFEGVFNPLLHEAVAFIPRTSTGWGDIRYVYDGTVIDGSQIITKSIQAGTLDVATLSSITANIGTVTSGLLRSTANVGNTTVPRALFRLNEASLSTITRYSPTDTRPVISTTFVPFLIDAAASTVGESNRRYLSFLNSVNQTVFSVDVEGNVELTGQLKATGKFKATDIEADSLVITNPATATGKVALNMGTNTVATFGRVLTATFDAASFRSADVISTDNKPGTLNIKNGSGGNAVILGGYTAVETAAVSGETRTATLNSWSGGYTNNSGYKYLRITEPLANENIPVVGGDQTPVKISITGTPNASGTYTLHARSVHYYALLSNTGGQEFLAENVNRADSAHTTVRVYVSGQDTEDISKWIQVGEGWASTVANYDVNGNLQAQAGSPYSADGGYYQDLAITLTLPPAYNAFTANTPLYVRVTMSSYVSYVGNATNPEGVRRELYAIGPSYSSGRVTWSYVYYPPNSTPKEDTRVGLLISNTGRLRIEPSSSALSTATAITGDLAVYNNVLYLFNGTAWVTVGGGTSILASETGTADKLVKWSAGTTIANSSITDNGTAVTMSVPLSATQFNGSGAGLTANTIPVASLAASGTRDSTTFLRGDGQWQPVLTSNQLITLSGAVAGSGTTAITTTLQSGVVSNTNVSATAAIAYSKLSLTGSIVNADISASAAIAYSKLSLTGSIVNSDISSTAAIAYSKLNLSNSIVNADISASAAIAYSKLNLSNSIVNADISTSAAIAYSKLNLSNSIVNADINANAAIVDTKLATITTAGKVANSATTATSANTANAIVARDGSGNFYAGTIYANDFVLTGGVGSTTGLLLDTLDDVVITAPIGAKNYLKYSLGSAKWVNADIAMTDLGTGTPSSSTYLRGDGTWSTISSGLATAAPTSVNSVPRFSGTSPNFTLTNSGITDDGSTLVLSRNTSVSGTLSVIGAASLGTSSTVPTPSAGDNTTKIASTAFVAGEISSHTQAVSKGGTGLTTAPSSLQLLVGQSGGSYGLRTLAGSGGSWSDNGSSLTFTVSTSGTVTGTGTSNTIAKWNGSSSITNSALTDNGSTLAYGGTAITVNGFTVATQSYVTGLGYVTSSGTVANATTATQVSNALSAGTGLSFTGGGTYNGSAAKTLNVSLSTLTISTGLSGTSYNGSSAVTIAIDSSVVTTTGSQTLTNKTLTSPSISNPSFSGTITANALALTNYGTLSWSATGRSYKISGVFYSSGSPGSESAPDGALWVVY